MTPEEAQDLDPREDHGPWTATGMGIVLDSYATPLVRSPDGNMGQQVADLVAAAPDMRATIAALRWEYALESEWSDGKWTTTTGWFPAPERARADLVLDGMPTRLVRRPVGPVEVVE
ncbi:hypothetical protein [Corynebacterium sp.]|uniref:hypothetical protein n=1 Tax=Corynebacterium sp. TaxID=1720 RepID=UPI003B3ABB5B